MASKKWQPAKEHRSHQHLTPSYIHNVMKDNEGKPGVAGTLSNVGNGSEDGAAFPKPRQGTGRAPWATGK